MPLSAALPTLAPALASAAESSDPAGIAAFAAIAGAICAGLPACCSSFDPTAGSTPMAVAAGVIAPGSGGLQKTSHLALGAAFAAASGSVDAEGIDAWLRIAKCIVDWMGAHAAYSGVGLVAYAGPAPPPAGAVTGLGKVSFSDENIGPLLSTAAGIQPSDDAGRERWTAIGTAILQAVKDHSEIAPTSLMNPAIGGVVTGVGTFS